MQNHVEQGDGVLELVILKSLALDLINLAKQLLKAHLQVCETLLIHFLHPTALVFDLQLKLVRLARVKQQLYVACTVLSLLFDRLMHFLDLVFLLFGNAEHGQFIETTVDEAVQSLNKIGKQLDSA